MPHGSECGLLLGEYKDFAVDDEIECLKIEYKAKPIRADEAALRQGGWAAYNISMKASKTTAAKA